MPKIGPIRVKIRKKVWTLESRRRLRHEGEQVEGLCDPPDAKAKRILVDEYLTGRQMFEVLLHEQIHAGQWDLSEEVVTELSHDLAVSFFDRLGYRAPWDEERSSVSKRD